MYLVIKTIAGLFTCCKNVRKKTA